MKNVLKLNNHNILSFLGRACHKRQQHHKKALRAQVQCQRRRDLCLRNVVFTTFKSIFFKKVQCTSFLNSFYFVPNRVLQSICLRTMSNTLVLFFYVQFFNVAKIKTSSYILLGHKYSMYLYRLIWSNRGRLGFYSKIQIIFGTALGSHFYIVKTTFFRNLMGRVHNINQYYSSMVLTNLRTVFCGLTKWRDIVKSTTMAVFKEKSGDCTSNFPT